MTVPDAPSGGAGGGTGESGGGAPCRALAVAGSSFVADDDVGYLARAAVNVVVSPEGYLFASQTRPNEALASNMLATFWFGQPFQQWPPGPRSTLELFNPSIVVATPGRDRGVSLVGFDPAAVQVDLTEDGPAAEVPIPGAVYPHALLVDSDHALAVVGDGLHGADDFSQRIVAFDQDWQVRWTREDIGCGNLADDKDAAPAIALSPGGGADLVATGDTLPGEPCTDNADGAVGLQARLLVLPLDADGSGTPILIEEDTRSPVSTMAFVPREQGPLLIYGRSTTIDNRELFIVSLGWSGQPTSPVRPLGLAGRTRDSISVAAVQQGFVVARVPDRDYDGAVSAALFDLEGNLIQEVESEIFPVRTRGGVRAVGSPEGDSVILAWSQEDPGQEPQGYGRLRLLRFDCVEP